jgi:hypothetical protein
MRGDDRHPDDRHPHLHHALEIVRDAAIEAELETGVREETREAARRSVLRRLARMTGGFGVVGLGVVLVPLPGPGLLVLAAGLAILSRDFVWAERTLASIERRIPRDAHGRIPRSTIALGLTMGTLGLATSLWWTFLR